MKSRLNAHKIDDILEIDLERRELMNTAVDILTYNAWFNYKRAAEILNEFDLAYLQACKYFENPDNNVDIRPISLFLAGEINTGKTTILVRFMHYCEQMASKKERPFSKDDIYLMETPVDVTCKRMFLYMLEELGTTFTKSFKNRAHPDEIIEKVIKELLKRKVKIVFLDELQNILDADLEIRDLKNIFNGFKKLVNRSQTRFILAGTPDAIELFKCSQWVDERYRLLTLPRWDFSKEFLDLLYSIHRAYKGIFPKWDLVLKDGRVNKELSLYLHGLSGGRLGKLIQDTKFAAVHALLMNKEEITREDYEYIQTMNYSVKNGVIVENSQN